MPKTIDAVYNPANSNAWKPVEEGEYPAHITTLDTREVNTKAGPAIVVNMQYKIAPEVKECTQPLYEMDEYNYVTDSNGDLVPKIGADGNQEHGTCEHLKDRTYRDNGTFVFLDSSSSGKNSRYFQLLENLNVELESDKVDGQEVKKLVLIEEDDVVGKAVIVRLKKETYVTSNTKHLPPNEQDVRTTFKVSSVNTWDGGKDITADELDADVPF
jgi:hypothetical protein|tara:strand:+ start:136 stop:777 length:642 start_codon:yes stop_codon:yes gene_type:complete